MQGFNMGRYVPPDLEGTTSGNKLHKKHPLGARASKLASHGALTVRFEMPFNVWCASCPKPTLIPQGVRFNAEKRRVGSYHSTPIWAFRIRHVACGGPLEIRTDPQNTAYVVAEGGTRQDRGEDKEKEGDMTVMTDAEREALRKNAFASLEKTIADREQLRAATERIDDLVEASARHWDDPYTQNQKLRKAFRVGRKERERDAAAGEDLKNRLSLGIDLVPATEQDAQRAALVDFGPEDDELGSKALAKPLFNTAKERAPPKGALKAEKEASRRKDKLTSEIMGNTRVSRDPFLNGGRSGDTKPAPRLPGVKRKRADQDRGPPTKAVAQEASSSGLVNYDSD